MATYAEASKTDAHVEENVVFHLLDPDGKAASKKVTLHSLPCRIHADGPAPVSDYFHVETTSTTPTKAATAGASDDDNNCPGTSGAKAGANDGHAVGKQNEASPVTVTHTSSFRGRKLVGKTLQLPPGVRGIVLNERYGTESVSPSLESQGSDGNPSPHSRQNSDQTDGNAEDDVHQRVFEEIGSFSDMVRWDRDSLKHTSMLESSLQWVHLARAVSCVFCIPSLQQTPSIDCCSFHSPDMYRVD